MIPYEQQKAQLDQRIDRYRFEAQSHRSVREIHGPRESLADRLRSLGRIGLTRSGASRVGTVLFGRENGPIQPAI